MSKPFHDLASASALALPENPELTACLRKLLEAKDCAVRARLSAQDPARAIALDAAVARAAAAR